MDIVFHCHGYGKIYVVVGEFFSKVSSHIITERFYARNQSCSAAGSNQAIHFFFALFFGSYNKISLVINFVVRILLIVIRQQCDQLSECLYVAIQQRVRKFKTRYPCGSLLPDHFIKNVLTCPPGKFRVGDYVITKLALSHTTTTASYANGST